MFKKLILFFVISNFNITFINSDNSKILHHDLIMLVDESEILNQNDLIADCLIIALCQKSSPIIVTAYTLNMILFDESKSKYIDDLSWDFYKSNKANFYLLIPKKYYRNLINNFKNELIEKVNKIYKTYNNLQKYSMEEILTGFKIDSKELKKLSALQVKQEVQTQPVGEINLDAIKEIFITFLNKDKIIKEHDLLSQIMGLWNIALFGHGSLPIEEFIDSLEDKITDGLTLGYLTFESKELRHKTNFNLMGIIRPESRYTDIKQKIKEIKEKSDDLYSQFKNKIEHYSFSFEKKEDKINAALYDIVVNEIDSLKPISTSFCPIF